MVVVGVRKKNARWRSGVFKKTSKRSSKPKAPELERLAPNLSKARETKKLFKTGISLERKEIIFELRTKIVPREPRPKLSPAAKSLPRPQLAIHPWRIYPSYGHWDDHFDDGHIRHMALNGLNKGDKINVAIPCGLGVFLRRKMISNFFLSLGGGGGVPLVCLLKPRCRSFTKQENVQNYMYFNFIGTWLSTRFTHAACEKAKKWINKQRKIQARSVVRKHSLPIVFSSCVRWDKAHGAVINLRVINRTAKLRGGFQAMLSGVDAHSLSSPFFSASICSTVWLAVQCQTPLRRHPVRSPPQPSFDLL